MKTPLLIGIGAGLLSAVIFAAAALVPLVARVLFFLLTPLPIALAGAAFGWRASTAAGAAGALGLFAAAGPMAAVVFAATQAAPVALLSHLALLNRTAADPRSGAAILEWYPPGRLVIWAALLASGLAVLSVFMLGGDLDGVRASLRSLLETFLKAQFPEGVTGPSGQPLGAEDIGNLVEAALYVFPAFMAMSWMLGLILALWLAGRILLAVRRLTRPWPDLAAMTYPRGTPLAFAAAALAPLFLSGYPALAASAVAGAFFLAYVLMGLAVLHYMTRGVGWRPFALWATYAALLLLSQFAAPLLAILGLAEAILPLRRGLASTKNPTSKPGS